MAAFLAALPAILAATVGTAQLIASQAGKPKRPTYSIPTAATESLDLSKRMAQMNKMPGQELMETQLGESTANMLGNIESMGGGAAGLGALSSIYSKESQARRNLGLSAANWKAGNMMNLQGALNRYAGWQDKAWQKNTGDKYQEEAAASSAMTQAGMSNMYKGISDISGMGAYGAFDKGATSGMSNNMNTTNPNMMNKMGMGGYNNMFQGTNFWNNQNKYFTPQGFSNSSLYNYPNYNTMNY